MKIRPGNVGRWIKNQYGKLKERIGRFRHRSRGERGQGIRRADKAFIQMAEKQKGFKEAQQQKLPKGIAEYPYPQSIDMDNIIKDLMLRMDMKENGFRVSDPFHLEDNGLNVFVKPEDINVDVKEKGIKISDPFIQGEKLQDKSPPQQQNFLNLFRELDAKFKIEGLRKNGDKFIPQELRHEDLKEAVASPPIIPEFVGATSVRGDAKDYLIQQQSKLPFGQRHLFGKLLNIHDDVVRKSQDPDKNAELAANVFGDAAFGGKILETNGRSLEGPGSEHAIFCFMEGLAAYCDILEETGDLDALEKLTELQEEYRSLYMSALFRRAIKSTTSFAEKDQLKQIAAEFMKQDILAVKNGEKPRSAWLAGSTDHFVPLRYELDKATGLLRIGAFNLGGGSSMLQEVDVSGKKVKGEARMGEVVEKPDGGKAILCTEEFLSENLDDICEKVVDIAATKPLLHWIGFLREKIPESQEGPQDKLDFLQSYHHQIPQEEALVLETVIVQKFQQIGDCTCRGQWALNKKEFDRLGIGDPHYKGFKMFMEKRALDRVQRPRVIALGNPHDVTAMNYGDIHQVCWAHHNILSPKKQERLKIAKGALPSTEKWKARIVDIPLGNKEEGYQAISLETLFNGKKRVIIGRAPETSDEGIQEDVAYYSLEGHPKTNLDLGISREHLELTVDDNGKIHAKVLGMNGIAIKTKDGQMITYQKGDTFELDENVSDLYLRDDEAHGPSSHKRRFHFG